MLNSNGKKVNPSLVVSMIAVGVVINVALGSLVGFAKLPIFVDSIGTIFITLLLGWRAGSLVGIASFLLMSVIVSPVYVYFIGTQIVIATYVYLVAHKFKLLKGIFSVVLAGIGLGVVAAIASAPVIVTVFGGVAGSGRDLITALLMSSGTQVVNAVMLSGAASEPIDKTIQLVLACLLLKNAPITLLSRFDSAALKGNKFFQKSL